MNILYVIYIIHIYIYIRPVVFPGAYYYDIVVALIQRLIFLYYCQQVCLWFKQKSPSLPCDAVTNGGLFLKKDIPVLATDWL